MSSVRLLGGGDARREIDRGGRLADAPFLVGNDDDFGADGHGPTARNLYDADPN